MSESNFVLRSFLARVGLEQHAEAFEAQHIDISLLPTLSNEDYRELGISIGDRKRIAAALAQCNEAAAPPEDRETTTPERRQLTIMFCDLVGSTQLSQELDIEDLREVLRRYQGLCQDSVSRHDGFIARYMGDGILAYFGFPRAGETDSERAVACSLEIVRDLTSVEIHGRRLKTRIGIATGLVLVGEVIGEGESRERTVVGDTPNLAARLQTLAEPGQILISESTKLNLGGLFDCASLGQRSIKGFAAPVSVWAVDGAARELDRFKARHQDRQLAPIVGREEELERLAARRRLAQHGPNQVVIVRGEGGIGKSRLTEAFCDQATQGSGSSVLRFQCAPHSDTTAYYAVLRRLRASVSDSGSLSADEALERLGGLIENKDHVALLASLLTLAQPEETEKKLAALPPAQRKELTVKALCGYVESVCSAGARIAVFEDLHWSDPSTLQLIAEIARANGTGTTVIGTCRPEFEVPWAADENVAVLDLERLKSDTAQALITNIAGRDAIPRRLVAKIVERGDGVPLFLEELAKNILHTTGPNALSTDYAADVHVPSTLKDSLMARLDRHKHVKEVAQTAAVIGRRFSHELLAGLVQTSSSELDGALRKLCEAELIQITDPSRIIYSFRHGLIRDVAYESLLKGPRQAMHLQVALSFEEQNAQVVEHEPQIVAYHFTQADAPSSAVKYWYLAGEQAMHRSAYAEASQQLMRALECLRQTPQSAANDQLELKIQVLFGAALVAFKGPASPEVDEAFTRARVLAREVGGNKDWLAAINGQWVFFLLRARYDLARELAEEMEKALNDGDFRRDRAVARAGIGLSKLYVGEVGTAFEDFERALHDWEAPTTEEALIEHRLNPKVVSLAYGARALWMLGFPERALSRAHAAVNYSKSIGELLDLSQSFGMIALLYQLRSDAAATLEHSENAINVTEIYEISYWNALGHILKGWAVAEQGDRAGIESIELGLQAYQSGGSQLGLSWLMSLLAEACLRHDDTDKAQHALTMAMEHMKRTGEEYHLADLLRLKATLLLRRSATHRDQAVSLLQDALRVADRQQTRAWALRAALLWAEIAQGKEETAAATNKLRGYYAMCTEGFDTPDLRSARALLEATEQFSFDDGA